MPRIDIEVTLTLSAPFITQSSSPGAYGLDGVLARDADERLIIPGTHAIGKLREAWEELRSAIGDAEAEAVPRKDEIELWLGDELADGEYTPEAKRMFFTDFVFTGAQPPASVRHRIRVDTKRGAVDSGALMSAESPFASGESAVFKGTLRFETKDNSDGAKLRKQLLCGFQWVPQIGAYRSIGFGRLQDVSIAEPVITELMRSTRNWGDAAGFDVILEPEEPFCIAGRPLAGNIFESKEEIPAA